MFFLFVTSNFYGICCKKKKKSKSILQYRIAMKHKTIYGLKQKENNQRAMLRGAQ